MQQSSQYPQKNILQKNDEMFQQNLIAWRHQCKQFVLHSLELIIQSRGASFGNMNVQNPLKFFGMHIDNMSDLEVLLSQFDSLQMANDYSGSDEGETPMGVSHASSELFLDITFKTGNSDQLLKQGVESVQEKNLTNPKNFFKRLQVYLRTIRTLSITLPSFNLGHRLQKYVRDKKGQSLPPQFFKDLKAEYHLNFKREKLDFSFPMTRNGEPNLDARTIVSISNTIGELNVGVEYINKQNIIEGFIYQNEMKMQKINHPPQNQFQQLLMNALGPSTQNVPSIQKPFGNIGAITDQGRFRANSDNTYNKFSNRSGFRFQNQIQQEQSPRVSEGFMIQDNYFTTEKNKLFYHISTKNSGNSQSSENKSTFSQNKGTLPFLPQLNLPTQGSTTIMKSSLEGGTFGNFDSHDIGSGRPSRPKIDPFKKFDNLNSSRNRNYRLSFDEGVKPLSSQRSFTSLNNYPQGGQYQHDRKNSININLGKPDFNSLPVQHQLIVEEEKDEFDIIYEQLKPSPTQVNDNTQNSNNPFDQLQQDKPAEGRRLHRINSIIIDQTMIKQQIIPEEPAFQNPLNPSLKHAFERRVSNCSNESALFRINERKKYIGFLEEDLSAEESEESINLLKSSEEGSDEETNINNFMSRIERFQGQKNKVEKTSAQIQDNMKFQNELRKNFFHLLEMRQIIIDNNKKLQHQHALDNREKAQRKFTL